MELPEPPAPPRRILGMSLKQVALLAAMLMANLIIVCGGIALLGWLSSDTSTASLAFSLATVTPTPTETPLPTPVPSPTLTPRPPATPIPGWEPFRGGGVSIMLPQSYDGGDATTDPQALFQAFVAAGADPEKNANLQQELAENHIAIFAYDTTPDDSYFFTVLEIFSDPVEADLPLSQYVNAVVRNLELSQRVVGIQNVMLDRYPAVRLLAEYKVTLPDGVNVYRESAIYLVKEGSQVWVIRFYADRDRFKEHLPVFDLSAATFAIEISR